MAELVARFRQVLLLNPGRVTCVGCEFFVSLRNVIRLTEQANPTLIINISFWFLEGLFTYLLLTSRRVED